MTPERDHFLRQSISEAALHGPIDGSKAEELIRHAGELTREQHESYYRIIASLRRQREEKHNGDTPSQ